MKNLKVAVLIILIVIWYLNVIQNRSSDLKEQQININSEKRTFMLSTNANSLRDKNAPVYIFLHGMEELWPESETTKKYYYQINSLAEKYNFLAVFPRGSKGSCDWDNNKYIKNYCWNTKTNIDRNFIKLLLKEVTDNYKTDLNRVYLSGFSNGAFFVVDYLLRYHDNDFSGYGVHAGGGYLIKSDLINRVKIKPDVFMAIGDHDEYQFNPMKELKNSLLKTGWQEGKNLKFYEFRGLHNLDKDSVEKEIQFFLKNE